jgi:OmpA-OmpF porin, OOP family
MQKMSLIIILFGLSGLYVNAWGVTDNIYLNDSIVKVSGIVYDSLSGDPIGGAVLTYEELPYGSIIGIIKTNKATGYFEFNTMGHEGYHIEIKSGGYGIYSENIFPLKQAVNGKIIKRIKLLPVPEEGDVIKLNHLIFAQGKSDITQESYSELNDLVKMLKENPAMVIQLEGHTDFRGSKTENMQLSENRVTSVKSYLTRKGIDKDRILTKAFGGTRPLNREETEDAARLNRRVEVRIIKK